MTETELLRQCVSFTFTWHTESANPCRKCQALNGRVWTDQTIWQPYLVDAEFGAIWDFTVDQPLTHPNCYCTLEISFTVDAAQLSSYKEFTAEVDKALAK